MLPELHMHKNKDVMVDKHLFSEIQTLLKVQFTLDACYNADGNNKQLSPYAAHTLRTDLSGHAVWLHPLFRTRPVQQMLQHYLECKAKVCVTTQETHPNINLPSSFHLLLSPS